MRVTEFTTLLDENRTCKLVKKKAVNYQSENSRMDRPAKISKMLCDVFYLHLQTEEHVYMLCMATDTKLIGVIELSHGIVNSSFCNNREIFQRALLCNASAIVIAHNHPSGDPTPSRSDIETCKKIQAAADIIGITFVDNIVIGDGNFRSFREDGFLN